ncbi:hypothetical protein AMTRI_Chr10g226180 [Amborella trichopoda]
MPHICIFMCGYAFLFTCSCLCYMKKDSNVNEWTSSGYALACLYSLWFIS